MNTLPAKSSKRQKPTIVVIEDNPDHWLIIQSVLTTQFSETTPIWLSGEKQVTDYLEESREKGWELPKLFLIDLYVPHRSEGWAILEMLKTDHLFRAVPAIVFSASTAEEDIRESYMFRANSYIVKPETPPEWQACFEGLRYYWLSTVTLPKSMRR